MPGVVTTERFARGLTYVDYIGGIETNQEEFVANYQEIVLRPEDQQFFAEVPRLLESQIKVLALAEDWCPDVVANLPVMARIAGSIPGAELRVFPRDENLDIMDQYLLRGQFRSVPTFVFFDQDFRELGRWIERPAAANQLREEMTRELTAQGMPEAELRVERGKRLRAAYPAQLRQETIREVREVLDKTVQSRLR
jgi:hypothetical protein